MCTNTMCIVIYSTTTTTQKMTQSKVSQQTKQSSEFLYYVYLFIIFRVTTCIDHQKENTSIQPTSDNPDREEARKIWLSSSCESGKRSLITHSVHYLLHLSNC